MRLRVEGPLIAMLAAVLLTGPARAAEYPDTHEYRLSNDMKVLVREDHRAPVATVMIWYGVGSADEPPGRTGLSHLLEHMMFKNTRHLQPGEFSKLVSRFGGTSNAFTSYDYTAYYQEYEVSRLPLALELEAERMRNLKIKPEEFQRERKVVLEERSQRVEDSPDALAAEKFSGITRPGTGYASPVIGWTRDLKQLTPAMARDWYERFYHPGNARLVVAGDVDPDQVRQLAERFFGDIPARETNAGLPRGERPVPGERRLNLELPVRVPNLRMSWNVPSLVNLDEPDDYYALTMLAGVLDGGQSARLESRLVRGAEIAAGTSTGYQGLTRGDGLFRINATPNPGTSLEELEEALLEQVRQLKKNPPDADELERVRARVTASDVYEKDSVFRQAMELGYLDTLGIDWRLAKQFSERLAEVTPEDVQQAAKQYLVPARSAVARVQPEAK
jgi:zinc protease